MPESGDFESFAGAPTGKETAGESQEKFSERYRQNQAAIKKIRRDEKKKKAQDDSLAAIISAFLQQKSKSGFFILISRLVAKNVPSDLILAILALDYAPAAEKIDEKLRAMPPENLPAKAEKNGLFSPATKAEIDAWTNTIARICRAEAKKIWDTARDPDGAPSGGLTQLFAMTLRDFLDKNHGDDLSFENLKKFGNAFFQKVFSDLKKIIGDQFLLKK